MQNGTTKLGWKTHLGIKVQYGLNHNAFTLSSKVGILRLRSRTIAIN